MADAKKNTSMVTLSKIQIQNGTERTMFATWTWNKANRAQCRKDRDEFEELAYSIQDEIISKVATAKED